MEFTTALWNLAEGKRMCKFQYSKTPITSSPSGSLKFSSVGREALTHDFKAMEEQPRYCSRSRAETQLPQSCCSVTGKLSAVPQLVPKHCSQTQAQPTPPPPNAEGRRGHRQAWCAWVHVCCEGVCGGQRWCKTLLFWVFLVFLALLILPFSSWIHCHHLVVEAWSTGDLWAKKI